MNQCSKCEKNFETEEALAQHRRAKHEVQTTPAKTGDFNGLNKLSKIAIVILVVGGIGYFVINSLNSQITYVAPVRLSDSPMHIHSKLSIFIDGEEQSIPINIGIGRIHMPLHTHESDGTIHVESEDTRNYTLGNFFQIWRKQFSEECIFDKCVENGKTLKMTVNGVENNEFDKHVLVDQEEIVITYK